MKELDVVLEAFLEHHHESLRRGGWPQLENLLAQEDERLWEWLLNPEKAAAFSPLIDALRKRT